MCDICGEQYDWYKNWWYHKNKAKKSCVPREDYQAMQLQVNEYKEKIAQLESDKKDRVIEKLHDDVLQLKDAMKERVIVDGAAHLLNQQQNVFYNYDNVFSFALNTNTDDRLKHLTRDVLLKILSNKDLSQTLNSLVKGVYFNPLEPRNMQWTIRDIKASCGGLEYDHQLKCVVSRHTEDLINKHVQELVFGIGAKLNQIESDNDLTPKQKLNCVGLCGLVGNQLDNELLDMLKKTAFENSQLVRVIWNYLGIQQLTRKVTLPRLKDI